jgi:multidrug resistance efflux pump
MVDLTPIPIPSKQKWKNFRLQTLPFLVFAMAIATLATMWNSHVTPPRFLALVDAARAEVSSPISGSLTRLDVARFQTVTAGDAIGRVMTTDPAVVQATLAVISAEVNLMQQQLDANVERTAVAYERLRLGWLRERVSLADRNFQLQFWEKEMSRLERLYADAPNRLVTERELDEARAQRDSFAAQVTELKSLISTIESRLTAMGPSENDGSDGVMPAIEVQMKKLRLAEAELKSVTLFAPIDGMVSAVNRRVGEQVAAGSPIVVISSSEVIGIVGYVRTPIETPIELGTKAVVRRNHRKGGEGNSEITGVGVQIEPIPVRLQLSGARDEMGLAVYLTAPLGMPLLPGEIVQVSMD